MVQTDSSLITKLPWQEISKLINSDQYKEQFASVPTETLEFAVDENNYQLLVEAALQSLKLTDPEKANLEQAAKIADKMKDFAAQALLERKAN